jgi:hypothetical protein
MTLQKALFSVNPSFIPCISHGAPVLPTNTTWTDAKLIQVSHALEVKQRPTYAAVAAKISAFLAVVNIARLIEKTTEKASNAPRRATILCT